jgi:hypothetical protein
MQFACGYCTVRLIAFSLSHGLTAVCLGLLLFVMFQLIVLFLSYSFFVCFLVLYVLLSILCVLCFLLFGVLCLPMYTVISICVHFCRPLTSGRNPITVNKCYIISIQELYDQKYVLDLV